MAVIEATPHGRAVLLQLTRRLSDYLTPELKALQAQGVDYALTFGPLVGLAVQVLKARGLSRDAIESAILHHMEKQFEREGLQGSLIQFPGGR